MKKRKKSSKNTAKKIVDALREKAPLHDNPGRRIETKTAIGKKDRKASGFVTPKLNHPEMKYSEIIQEGLEPGEEWDDWVDYRDGMRHNTTTDHLYHKWKGCICKDSDEIKKQNKKIKKQIEIRQARKENQKV